MFQQIKTSSTPPSSIAILARIGNPTVFLTLFSSTLIIHSGTSYHMARNKSIVCSLVSTCSFPSVILFDVSTFSVQAI